MNFRPFSYDDELFSEIMLFSLGRRDSRDRGYSCSHACIYGTYVSPFSIRLSKMKSWHEFLPSVQTYE
jgi:hypothetical protein